VNITKHETSNIPNAGQMSEFIGPFEVHSRLTDSVYRCNFSYLSNGIATRHADTVDFKFFVNGRPVLLGLAHPAIYDFRMRSNRDLTDRELSYVAAEYLRERLEQEDEHSLYEVSASDVARIIASMGLR
jgi:hypothetical protein